MNAGRCRYCGLAVSLLVIGVGATQAAPPQTVYRCGPEGRVYSQTPCADGRAVTIDDSRSAQQQEAAREIAEREAQQAQALAEKRQQREAAAAGQGISGIKMAPAQVAASAPAGKSKKAKATQGDDKMSPPMRAPLQTPASTSK